MNYFFKKTKQGREIIDRWYRNVIATKKEFKKEVINTEEGQKMIREKLKELQGKMTELNVKLNELKHSSAVCPDSEDWFFKWWIDDLKAEIKKLKSKIYQFQLMKKLEDGMQEVDIRDESIDVDEIKERVLIHDIMDRSPVSINGDRETYNCPFHQDKSPSFTVYRNQNSWYCYSCCHGGSVIDLYMEMNDVDFVTACKALLK